MNTGKTLGFILVAAGLGLCLIAALWVGAGVAAHKYTDMAAPVLGLGLAFILSAPIVGIGVFLLFRGKQEEKDLAYVQQERKLLGMVQARGQVDVAQAALELGVTRNQLRDMVYDLVNKGFFTGYINWNQGVLYSVDAAKLTEGKRCPNCRAEMEFSGKGVLSCAYCGTEIFLS